MEDCTVKLSYDLHIHSCLSPCGDGDMTPANIAGMAAIKELEVIALTDHNSCKNCTALRHWAEEYGILFLPGMELTTREEVHVLCFFANIEDAMAFDSYVYKKLNKYKNDPELFGPQIIYNENDQVIGEEEFLLLQSTEISFNEVYGLMEQYHGVMVPAHIDKNSNSLLYNLGFVPEDSRFRTAEIANMKKKETVTAADTYFKECLFLCDSDAHYLTDIHEKEYYLTVEKRCPAAIIDRLLRG